VDYKGKCLRSILEVEKPRTLSEKNQEPKNQDPKKKYKRIRSKERKQKVKFQRPPDLEGAVGI